MTAINLENHLGIQDSPENPEEKTKTKKSGRTKKILKKVIGTILYIAFIFGLVYATPRVLSYSLNTDYPMAAITSGSMWPTLKKGDLIFVEGINPRDVQVGDIIVYVNIREAFTIHRVVELRDDELVTKGDANNIADNPIKYEDIIGRLYKIGDKKARIPKLGFVSTYFSKFAQ